VNREVVMSAVTDRNVQHAKFTENKILNLINFGVLNKKMTLKIENWLWFPSYRRDIIRMRYHTVDE
jgi:hypothetical protein